MLNSVDTYFGICGDCRAYLRSHIMSKQICMVCGKSLISEKNICLSCREKTEQNSEKYNDSISKLRTVFPYTGKFKKLLGAYKFQKSIGIANFFIDCLHLALTDLLKEDENFNSPENATIAWVPVPPKPGKIKKQGWDQIRFITRLLEKKYRQTIGRNKTMRGAVSHDHIPVIRCLERLPSRSQKELNREERKENLKGKIICVKPPPRIAVIFDDVLTTGATLNACSEAMLKSGAEKVFGICLFYD